MWFVECCRTYLARCKRSKVMKANGGRSAVALRSTVQPCPRSQISYSARVHQSSFRRNKLCAGVLAECSRSVFTTTSVTKPCTEEIRPFNQVFVSESTGLRGLVASTDLETESVVVSVPFGSLFVDPVGFPFFLVHDLYNFDTPLCITRYRYSSFMPVMVSP